MNPMIETELEYLKCFSKSIENENIIRFWDDKIKNMYSHNLTYIKRDHHSLEDFKCLLQKEIVHSKDMKKSFLNLQFDFSVSVDLEKWLETEPCDMTVYDYYQYPTERYEILDCRNDCEIHKLEMASIDTALELDIRINGDDLGKEFIKRRFLRRSQVYLEAGLVDNYICSYKGEAVGHCDLFINGSTAKIEDFDVTASKRHQGFGTAMLKYMIGTAIKKGANTIYLITDHSDTAKDMYEKCGFTKVDEKHEILFEF